MKTSRLLVDIETGGLMTDLPLEVMHQYENEPPKFTETDKEQSIKRTNRKVVIVGAGVPMGFHYSPTLADINPEQYKIYAHARSGRSNLAEILMFKMMLQGKSVVRIEPNGEITELERGIEITRGDLLFPKLTTYTPYEPMKRLTLTYKERFRLNRLKEINNK